MLDSHGSDIDAAGIALMLDLECFLRAPGTDLRHFVSEVADDWRRMWQSW